MDDIRNAMGELMADAAKDIERLRAELQDEKDKAAKMKEDWTFQHQADLAARDKEIERLRGALNELLLYCEDTDPDPGGFLDAIDQGNAALEDNK